MEPTLESGQFVLVDPHAVPGVGEVVVAQHPSQAIEIVKRVVSIDPMGLVELRSDNPDEGTDSRTFGRLDVAHILGTVTISLDWPFPAVERR